MDSKASFTKKTELILAGIDFCSRKVFSVPIYSQISPSKNDIQFQNLSLEHDVEADENKITLFEKPIEDSSNISCGIKRDVDEHPLAYNSDENVTVKDSGTPLVENIDHQVFNLNQTDEGNNLMEGENIKIKSNRRKSRTFSLIRRLTNANLQTRKSENKITSTQAADTKARKVEENEKDKNIARNFERLKVRRRNGICEKNLDERHGLKVYLDLYMSEKFLDRLTDW